MSDVLGRLRALPLPRLSPFFARRISAATAPVRSKRTPWLLWIYWLVVAYAATPLLGSRFGIAMVVVIGAMIAFPSVLAATASALIKK